MRAWTRPFCTMHKNNCDFKISTSCDQDADCNQTKTSRDLKTIKIVTMLVYRVRKGFDVCVLASALLQLQLVQFQHISKVPVMCSSLLNYQQAVGPCNSDPFFVSIFEKMGPETGRGMLLHISMTAWYQAQVNDFSTHKGNKSSYLGVINGNSSTMRQTAVAFPDNRRLAMHIGLVHHCTETIECRERYMANLCSSIAFSTNRGTPTNAGSRWKYSDIRSPSFSSCCHTDTRSTCFSGSPFDCT